MFSVKKLLLASLLTPSLVFGSVDGVGEYKFGPETSQNTACEFAEYRAREAAILKFFGEQIESITRQECKNEDCEFHNEIFREVKGIIKKIIDRELQVIQEEGYSSCIVKIKAEVQPVENDIKFLVSGSLEYTEGDVIDFKVSVNKPGVVVMFNYVGDIYRTVYATRIDDIYREVKLSPKNGKIVATLNQNHFQTKELVAFLFTEYPMTFKENYTALEMKNMLGSIPLEKKQIIYRYVTIVRKS